MTARKIGLRIATKLHASEGNLANIQLPTGNCQLGYDGRGAEDEVRLRLKLKLKLKTRPITWWCNNSSRRWHFYCGKCCINQGSNKTKPRRSPRFESLFPFISWLLQANWHSSWSIPGQFNGGHIRKLMPLQCQLRWCNLHFVHCPLFHFFCHLQFASPYPAIRSRVASIYGQTGDKEGGTGINQAVFQCLLWALSDRLDNATIPLPKKKKKQKNPKCSCLPQFVASARGRGVSTIFVESLPHATCHMQHKAIKATVNSGNTCF